MLIALAIFTFRLPWHSKSFSPALRPIADAAGLGTTGVSRPPLSVDLNHDNRPDTVTLVSGGQDRQTIQVNLDGIGNRELKIENFHRGFHAVVYAADVDHDNNLDLIRESENRLEPLTIWLGDGKGNFSLAEQGDRVHVDFYVFPPVPYRPSSPPGPRGSGSVSASTAQRPTRVRFNRPLDKQSVTTDPWKAPLRTNRVRVVRELLLWTARKINAPPLLSASA